MKWRETKKKSSKITFLYHKESRWFKNDSARILLYFWLFYVSPIDIFCVVNVMLYYLPSPTASNKNPCKCLLQNAILNRILIVKLYFRIRETLHAKLCNSLNEFVCNGNAENDVRVCVCDAVALVTVDIQNISLEWTHEKGKGCVYSLYEHTKFSPANTVSQFKSNLTLIVLSPSRER